jgi:hypothetical protein
MPRDQRRDWIERLRWSVEEQDIVDWLCRQLEAVDALDL